MILHCCRYLIAGICVVLATLLVANYPLNTTIIFVGLGIYTILLWFYPDLWIFLVPVAIPLVNFAPWSGWFFFDLLDALLLLTLALFLCRQTSKTHSPPLSPRELLLIVAISFSVMISCIIGLWPFPPLDANSFSNYHSHYNALRVGKGFFWGLILALMLRHNMCKPKTLLRYFAPGLLAGLSGVCLWVLWERQVYSGLFNFDSDFRIVGPFSGMHIGGVGIDAYLALVFPWVLSCFFLWRQWWVKILGLGLTGVGLYAILVTFSRIAYGSLSISLLLLIGGLMLQKINLRNWLLGVVGLLLFGALVVWPISQGDFIQQRFESVGHDIGVRQHHWYTAFNMRDTNWKTLLFGMGLGSYPRTYAFLSDENERPSDYRFINQPDEQFLRLPSDGYLYMDQRVNVSGNQNYCLSFNVRTYNSRAHLTAAMCEKSLLYSFRCQWMEFKCGDTQGQWQSVERCFNSGVVGSGNWIYQRRPVVLSLLNPKKNTVCDVDKIQLLDREGHNFLKNGDFSSGSDNWLFTADNHLPWHAKNLWVHLLFEQGWCGVLLFSGLIVVCVYRCFRLVIIGDRIALLVLSSIGGISTVGLIGSVLDFPRITILLCLLLSLGCWWPGCLDQKHWRAWDR